MGDKSVMFNYREDTYVLRTRVSGSYRLTRFDDFEYPSVHVGDFHSPSEAVNSLMENWGSPDVEAINVALDY
jgi:hypothetical protein